MKTRRYFFYQTDYVRAQLNGNWSAFTCQINVTPNTNGGDFCLITTAGLGQDQSGQRGDYVHANEFCRWWIDQLNR